VFDPELREDELFALQSMYGEENVRLIPHDQTFFRSDTDMSLDARKLLIPPQTSVSIRPPWLLRQYSVIRVVVDLDLDISPKLKQYSADSSAHAQGAHIGIGDANESVNGSQPDNDISNVIVEFFVEYDRYPGGALPLIQVSHHLLQKAGSERSSLLLQSAHEQAAELVGSPCLFAVLSFIVDEVTEVAQQILDSELSIVEAEERQRAAELKAKLKEQQELEEARQKVRSSADPRKLQAQIEVCDEYQIPNNCLD